MNDSKFFIFSIIIALLPVSLNAQLRKQVAKKEASTPVVRNNYQTKTVPDKHKVTSPDTVYCISTKKQHGWFLPMDIVTKEKAMKHGSYRMFTQKNEAGHFTKIESFDGYGNHKYHGGNFYALDPEDPKGNEEWKERMKKDCITLFVTDPSGENVIQERVYDENMNLIVSFSRTPIGNNKYIGTYKDFYGFPVETRDDPGYTYGTLVVITEDKWGNDSIVEYVDAKGVPKDNYNAVGMSVYIHDKYGRICRQYSADHNGHMVMDNWGNCGIEVKYRGANSLISEKICMDNTWKPMVMPNLRDEAGSSAGVMRFLYDYDEYGRLICYKFVDMEGNPATNAYGAHRIDYSYDEHGNIVSMAGYDIENQPAAFYSAGTAFLYFEYDDKGRETGAIFLDKNKAPCSTPGYFCRSSARYDNNGELIMNVQWSIVDGVEDTTYFYQKSKYFEKYYWSDGGVRIDSLDNKRRIVSSSFYDRKMKPFSYEHIGYQRYVTDYTDFANGTDYTTKYYDINGNLYGEKAIQRCLVDSITHIEKFWDYDSNGNLVQTYIHKKDSLGNVLCQSDMNAFGVICRAGGSGRARLYNGEVFWTPKKSESALSQVIGKDEFGDPDYIDGDGDPFYYFIKKADGSYVYYDGESKNIRYTSSYWEIRDRSPKVMSIEVVDSIAYKYGLKDNDIIVVYDNYALNLNDSISDYDFKTNWALNSVLSANKAKRMVVFRVDPATLDYYLAEVDNLMGTPSQLGFIAHRRFLTQKQKDRILKVIEADRTSNRPILTESDLIKKNEQNGHFVLVAYSDCFRDNRAHSYHLNVNDASILLGSSIQGRKKWLLEDDDIVLYKRYFDREEEQEVVMYCTKDLNTITKYSFSEPEWRNGVRWLYASVDDATYHQLCHLKNKIKKEVYEAVPNLPKKQLVGRWIKEVSQEEDIGSLELCLMKNGTASCNATINSSEEINDSVSVNLSGNIVAIKGKWTIRNRLLTLDFEDSIKEITLAGINIEGLEGTEKDAKISEIKELFELNKKEIVKDISAGLLNLSDENEFDVEMLGANKMVLVKKGDKMVLEKIE